MKTGNKNKSVAFIILVSVYIYIYTVSHKREYTPQIFVNILL